MPLGFRSKVLMEWMLTTHPHQRVRVAMAGCSSLLMLCCAAIVNWIAAAGLARQDWVLWWTLFSGLGLLLVVVLIRSGWSLRLQDPSLTQFQIRYALLCNAVAYVILGQARSLTPVILSLIVMFGSFGTFGLSPRKMLMNVAYALLVFGLAFAVVRTRQEPGYVPALEAAHAAMVVLVLLGSTFIAVRMQQIRHRLVQQKHALSKALEQISHLAQHDELTGLVNRRHMLERMEAERLRCQRSGRPLLLALLDLDHFKSINDSHGHAAGDRVLQAFVGTVQKVLRPSDVLARWGGEEFVLMLPDTDSAGAEELLERLREAVQALQVPVDDQTLCITVSLGLAA
ncbi:MAG: diguanylate cyclase, partial [Simplicispira sp.]|nr:diguanylate cyclase [Simplicispira sp.]